MEMRDLIQLVQSGRKEEALRRAKEALQQDPDQIPYLIFFAALTPDLDEGIRALQHALELDPQHAAARKGLADLLEKKARMQASASPVANVMPPSNEAVAPSVAPQVTPSSASVEQAAASSAVPVGASLGQEIIAFAGEVRWKMRGLNLPLREAIQAGHVTEKDLEWAGQKAYNPELAWAAAVMLRAAEVQTSPLTLEEALALRWPFKNLNRPIGELLQQGKLTLWNLAYTLVRGPDLRLRQACALAGYALLTRRITVVKSQEGEEKSAEKNDVPPSQPVPGVQAPAAAPEVALPSSASPARASMGEGRARPEPQSPNGAPDAARPSPEPRPPVATATGDVRPRSEPSPAAPRSRTSATGEARSSSGANQRARQPANLPSRKLPVVYQGSSYLDRQILEKARVARYLYWGIATLLFLMSLSVPLMLLLPKPVSYYLAMGAFSLAGVLYFVMPRFEMAVQERNQYMAGQKGEEELIRLLQRNLDESWVIFRNIDLPDRQGDIDLVLVGPGGMYALEVKVYSGNNRNFGERWQRKYLGRWVALEKNPSEQAKRNAVRLSNFLREAGLNVWVEPRVVWAGEGKLWLKKPAVPVWKLAEPGWIESELKKGKKSLESETVQRVVGMLKVYLQGYHHSG